MSGNIIIQYINMSEPIADIEIYKHDLSEAESHLARLQQQLNTDLDNDSKQSIENDIAQVETQINYYKAEIAKLK